MKIEHISVSRVGTYQNCPASYKYKYHDGVPTADPPPIYFTFGKIVHVILESYTKCHGETKINDIANDVLLGNIEIEPGKKAPKLVGEYKTKLWKHIGNFMRLTEKIGTDGEVEWKFNIDLDPPNNRCATGFIDRLIKKDDGYFIIDYKTTKVSPWRKTSLNITGDLQLQTYCWVVRETFKVPAKDIKAALYYLEDGLLVPACFSERTLDTVPERLLHVYKEIEKTHPDRAIGRVGDHCRRCDFRSVCCFYSLV